jgi:hypothetical protein
MANISDRVGAGSALNLLHDVALVQAMLKHIRGPKGHPFLVGHYDGVCGTPTIDAIKAFQLANDTASLPLQSRTAPSALGIPALALQARGVAGSQFGIPALKPPQISKLPQISGLKNPSSGVGAPTLSLKDELGAIRPGGPTMKRLNDLLPVTHKGIRTAPGAHVVYWSGSAQDAADSAAAVAADTNLNAVFRQKISDLVTRMFTQYELVLEVVPQTGGLRAFQDQYRIRHDTPSATQAGPGESNHNFGQAVDIGYPGLQWMRNTGESIIETGFDLKKMMHINDRWKLEMWALRNAIAYGQLGLFKTKKKNDDEHIQMFDDNHVSMPKSLARLLSTAGRMRWRSAGSREYECDLGFGGHFHKVGEAMQIWDKSGPVDKAWIAAGKHIAVTAVTDADVAAMRAALKAEFDAAEAAAGRWVAIP